jgi:hypothetical protein
LSTGVETSIWVSADETVALFTAPGPSALDIWTATRATASSAFGARTRVAASTVDYDYEAMLSPDGLTMYFNNNADVLYSTRSTLADDFVTSTPLPVAATGGAQEGDPHIAASGLYFAHNGYDGNHLDIWYAPRLGNGFGAPVPLSELNGPAEDEAPVLSVDELTIYFLSTRSGGLGDRDIWVSHRAAMGAPFDPPKNVTELNTKVHEWPGAVSTDGCRLYLTRGNGSVWSVEVASKPPL